MDNSKREKMLVITKDKRMFTVIKMAVELSFHLDLIEIKDPSFATTKLKELGPDVKVSIYDYTSHDFPFLEFLERLKQVNAGKVKIPLILLIDKMNDKLKQLEGLHFVTIITKEGVFDSFISMCEKIMGKTSFDFDNPIVPGEDGKYHRIDIELLKSIDGLEESIFIRQASGRYTKLFQASGRLTDQDIEKYKLKEIKYVYIKGETGKLILNQMKNQSDFFLKNSPFKFIIRHPDEAQARRFEQKILRCNEQLAMDRAFQKQIEAVVNKTAEKILAMPNIKTLMATLRNKYPPPGQYLTEHMFLLSYVSCTWAAKLKWHSKGTKEKLIYASILHDITLAGKPELAEYGDLKSIKDAEGVTLSQDDIKLIKNHPKECALLLRNCFPSAPPETEQLILQHHERPDGKGFPTGLNWSKLQSLTCLFILSHDYVDHILKNENSTLEQYLEIAYKRFPQSQFQTILNVLKDKDALAA